MKLAVIGTGYVGLVTGAVLSHLGNQVICVDKDNAKLDLIKSGKSPIYEPGLEGILQKALQNGLLSVSNSIPDSVAQCDIVLIAVGTPPAGDGTPDMTAVRAVAKEIAHGINKYTVVVNKSTVPVGSADLVSKIIAEAGANSNLFTVLSNPEFLREGSAVSDMLEPDRIVIGAQNQAAAQPLVDLYTPLGRPIQVTDLHSAELIKYASNSFLAMKISFINAMSVLCEQCDADIVDVAKGMGLDSRIGSTYLSAGLGWGGSCFPKDVIGLIASSAQMGYDFQLLKEVWDINERQTYRFVDRLAKELGGLDGKTIGLLGLAFKPNTDDIRDAKSLIIIDRLLKGGASIQAYDPAAANHVLRLHPEIRLTATALDVAKDANAVMLVTEWPEFKELDLHDLARGMKSPVFFDGRRIFDPKCAKNAGLKYFTIGLQGK